MQRFFGAESEAIARAFDHRGTRQAIFVAWDYDAACRPVISRNSARWSTTERAGVFSATPRPVSDWIDGIPTFDLFFAVLEPYPYGQFFEWGYRGTDRLRTEPSLTAVEYFELFLAMPSEGMIKEDPEGAQQLLERWVAEHPQLSKKYPAYEALNSIRREIDRHRQATPA